MVESSDLITISNIPSNDSSLLDHSDELSERLGHDGAGEHAGTAQQHVVGVVRDLKLFSSSYHYNYDTEPTGVSAVTSSAAQLRSAQTTEQSLSIRPKVLLEWECPG